jgi:hypothetical protein
MKIVIYTQDQDLFSIFNKFSSSQIQSDSTFLSKGTFEIIIVKTEKYLFDHISDSQIDAFSINVPSSFSKKAIDFIKRKNPYIPISLFGLEKNLLEISGADIYLPILFNDIENSEEKKSLYYLSYQLIVQNTSIYLQNFDKLKKLTTTIQNVIEFNDCKYDPTRRILYYNDKEIKKLSAKEGGILEILSSNYGQVIKRDIILEKVWHKSDYFSGRSMDVYLTHLRKVFTDNKIGSNIKNISGVGLILE